MKKAIGFLVMAGSLLSLLGCCPTRTCGPDVTAIGVSTRTEPIWSSLRTHTGETLSGTIREAVRSAGPKPMNVLILSGGGQYGAFGAGFLYGLAARGDQPDLNFNVVTGISTGALQASMAFLGPEYYDLLRKQYTGVTQEDIIRKRCLFGLVCASSLMDAAPLRSLVEKYVTMEVLHKIAEAYEGGRRLYIGTVNLDTGDFFTWNMGEIAARRTEAALGLYHDILMAAVAIPVVFPPVLIRQETGSGAVSESLHADGGVREAVFFRQFMLELKRAIELEGSKAGSGRPIAAHDQAVVTVIINGKLGVAYQCTPERFIPVGLRSLSVLTDQSSINSVFRTYALACANGISFRMTRIPDDFQVPGSSWTFDPEAMTALFELGKEMALSDPIPWETKPPTGEDIDALCK
jgi:hypothetical protein